MKHLRIAVIADPLEHPLISNTIIDGLDDPKIIICENQQEFEKSVKLHNCDILIVREQLVDRGFFSQLKPLLELTKIPLLVLKDGATNSLKKQCDQRVDC